MRKASLAVAILLTLALAAAEEKQNYQSLPSFLFENTYKTESSFKRGLNTVLGQATCFAVDLSAYGYSGKRIVITAGHFTENKMENKLKEEMTVRIRTREGFEWVKAKVLAVDFSRDIALLVLDYEVDSLAKLAKKDNLKRGDALVGVGAPGGAAITPTEGYLLSKENEDGDEEIKDGWWQASFPISPGNSGGPVWDPNRKEIVGIVAAGQASAYGISPNVAYFVSLSSLDKFLRSDAVRKSLQEVAEAEKQEKNEEKEKRKSQPHALKRK